MPGPAATPVRTAPPLAALLTGPTSGAATRLVAPARRMRGRVGDFLIPASPRAGAKALLGYNRLRPRRVRIARAVSAAAIRFGAGPMLTDPAALKAVPGERTLLDVLREQLGVADLVVAGTDFGGTGLHTPVVQLFTPAGEPVGYAKVGWDPVTINMVDTEVAALERAAGSGWTTVAVPEVRWHGDHAGRRVLVTAPMPRAIRRIPKRDLPPIDPLLEVATLWAPPYRHALTASRYWASITTIADTAAAAGRVGLRAALQAIGDRHGDLELTFASWHGDWVEWNLGRVGDRLIAWDWAYSAPDVPFGFDLLQFFHLRHRNVRRLGPNAALAQARSDAKIGLRALGLGPDECLAVGALHAVEVARREEHTLQIREPVGAGRGSR